MSLEKHVRHDTAIIMSYQMSILFVNEISSDFIFLLSSSLFSWMYYISKKLDISEFAFVVSSDFNQFISIPSRSIFRNHVICRFANL